MDVEQEDLEKDTENNFMERQPTATASVEKVLPKGEEELRILKEKRIADEKRIEEEEVKYEQQEESRRIQEIKLEEEAEDREFGANPQVDLGRIRYEFTQRRRPRLLSVTGDLIFKEEGHKTYAKLFAGTALRFPTPSLVPFHGKQYVNSFTVTFEFRLDSLPTGSTNFLPLISFPKVNASKEYEGRLCITPDGSLNIISGNSIIVAQNITQRIRKNAWHVMNVVFNCSNEDGQFHSYLDGKPMCSLQSVELIQDGKFSLDQNVVFFHTTTLSNNISLEFKGGDIRFTLIQSECLDVNEITAIYETIQAEGAWNCEVCTYRNSSRDTRCTACGSLRPSIESFTQEWQCNACTCFNPASATICSVCETPKQ
jgi:hypothetical protein